MRLIKGKWELINTIKSIITEYSTHKLMVHGIVDNEVLKAVNEIKEMNSDLDIKIICSKINPSKLQGTGAILSVV